MPHDLEPEKLERLICYLQENIAGFSGFRELKKFAGGQSNPTYLATADSGSCVIRRKPFGQLLKSAHAVDREYFVQKALADTAVPVPEMYAHCPDPAVIGSEFYVLQYMQGRIFWDPALPDCDAAERHDIYMAQAHTLAALHNVDPKAVGLDGFGKAGDYYARQYHRWRKQYLDSQTEDLAAMTRLMDWIEAHLQEFDDSSCLIHGDYRLDNLVFHPDRPEIIAILDWELSTIGNPLADLAYSCLPRYFHPDWPIKGLAGRTVEGVPALEEYVAAYGAARGLSQLPDLIPYIAFSLFRLAAIIQGVRKRSLQGNASSAQSREVGAMAGPVARIGCDLLGL